VVLRPGLNVVTGESGAGKSVLVMSLGQLLGFTAVENCIRAPATSACVEGRVKLPAAALVCPSPTCPRASAPSRFFGCNFLKYLGFFAAVTCCILVGKCHVPNADSVWTVGSGSVTGNVCLQTHFQELLTQLGLPGRALPGMHQNPSELTLRREIMQADRGVRSRCALEPEGLHSLTLTFLGVQQAKV
jgi:hypothetical protein